MKKVFIVLALAMTLTGCSLPIDFGFETKTTQPSFAQLTEEDLENIKNQVVNEVRQDILEQYSKELTETENKIINVIKAKADAVLGVSNFKIESGVSVEQGTGSGVIYNHNLETGEYYVITNEHVIDDADEITVVLSDGTYIDATLIGADKQTDLAVIKFTSSIAFPVAHFADSDELERGQFAIAIGNPLGYDYFGSITFGVVSGLSRNIPINYDNDNVIDWYATLIQHDASISPGNSGGALFDIRGKLIGINNMKIVDSDVSNIGFAIPSNTVVKIIEDLETYGEVIRPSLGITGMAVADVLYNNERLRVLAEQTTDPEEKQAFLDKIIEIPEGVTTGVYVDDILENSSAYGSELQSGDIIIKFNNAVIETFDDLKTQIDSSQVGDVVTLTVNRNGDIKEITLELLRRPGY